LKPFVAPEEDEMMISADQAKEARRLLGWSFKTFESKCKIGATTIRSFETGEHRPAPFKVLAIRHALEAAGIEFGDKGHGVRMREAK
jgi:transcriptional regulator with XRE-family HTH domain